METYKVEIGRCQKCNLEREIKVHTPFSIGLTHLKLCDRCSEEPVFCQLCENQIEWFDGMKYKDLIIEVDADWPYILCEDCDPDSYTSSVIQDQEIVALVEDLTVNDVCMDEESASVEDVEIEEN